MKKARGQRSRRAMSTTWSGSQFTRGQPMAAITTASSETSSTLTRTRTTSGEILDLSPLLRAKGVYKMELWICESKVNYFFFRYLFNDAEVKPFDSAQLASECFGGEMTVTICPFFSFLQIPPSLNPLYIDYFVFVFPDKNLRLCDRQIHGLLLWKSKCSMLTFPR